MQAKFLSQVLVLAVGLSMPAQAQVGPDKGERSVSLADAVEKVRPAIVQIAYEATHLPEETRRQVGRSWLGGPLGTGFFVNSDGYVITARHVITGGWKVLSEIQGGEKRLIAGVAAPNLDEPVRFRGSFFSYEFGVVDQDERHDLALLKLKLNPFEKPPVLMKTGDEEIRGPLGVAILDPRKPRDGAAVAISGYPLGQPVLVTNAGWMATTWSSETSELRPPGGPDLFRAQDVTDSYLADVEANKGNSGGPVYLAENGAVVGICIGSKAAPVQDQAGQDVTIDGHQLLYSSGLTVVVPAQYVIDLLKKNGLKWTESE